ncbi:MAG: hypothetical protein IH966_06635 [Gemmatimonadetes bacterium]|nr:hypothetical protein [Gemmatimonadota bacterium]
MTASAGMPTAAGMTTSATTRAVSFQIDWTQSPVAEAAYLVQAATPILSLPSGEYPEGTEVGGMGHQKSYLELIAGFMGFTDIRTN